MNSNLLKAKIVENGITQAIMAKNMGISPNSLCRKINGLNEFTLSELIKIMHLLNITDDIETFHNIFMS